ncbi:MULTISPECIES: extracellular solute-binding protein [Microbacterium]|uniref:extracellular solute-binding protein n=1 Tax=Microbacterium TaxID=33882 RepID=UPI002787FC31|nr:MULTISPECIES: extracellular solute-binding protein [Microbacterium]MDQ1085144.1 raffinose/stachyose/melibiose transport system substrate-binding protein [Microbacterium sp. SORGH_AS_0344]MDQ1169550.1 raffinose/stachyose/melibiose transport system substrate-binding protein [Microbacterium proteolyticum]
MNTRTIVAGTALAVAGTLALAGCAGGGGGGQNADGSVTLTLWHNSTTGDGKQYWEDTAAAFEEANPGVTIEIQSLQNEEMDGKLQTALNAGDAPDLFMARGGGKLADIVEAGQAMDLTDKISPEAKTALGTSLGAFEVDGRNYGMPVAVLPSGIFTSQDLLTAAGVTEAPATISDLEAANAKIRATGVAPIAVGAKDAWPAAHWYYNFALRACSKDVLDAAAESRSFDDPCWLEAGENLQSFLETQPFNEGFLTTAAQQGAGSSAGLLANHQAAMELMGAWNPGVIASLTPDEQPLADLGWFPFPEVPGGDGGEGAIMGGVDGYSCWVNAPAQCTDFLNFLVNQENQERYADAFQTIPASSEATGAVTTPALQSALEAYTDAPYVSVWLDTLYGQNIGNALNVAVVDMFAGKGTPQSIVDGVNAAAARS